jgi:hypothetical protein
LRRFVKVYLALAHAAGITARQWAFSFDGFGGHGTRSWKSSIASGSAGFCLDVVQ